jgi:predicted transcriptional regulator
MDWLFLGLAVLGVAALVNISNKLDQLANTTEESGAAIKDALQELLDTTRRIEDDISGWLVDQQVVDPEDEFDPAGNPRAPRRYR